MTPEQKLSSFSPERRVVEAPHGYIVYVKPPAVVGTPEVSVFLTPAQYARYQQWFNGPLLIQEALPELSSSQREMLLSGLGDADFARMTQADDE